MNPPPTQLEEPYRSSAIPPGTPRFFSWLFSAPEMRSPLLGVYALTSEWHALSDPKTEPSVAHIKLGWWREELERTVAGRPVHPVTRFLRALPRAGEMDFSALEPTLGALDREISGLELDSPAALEVHARALRSAPLALASALAGHPLETGAAALTALAVGQHRALALSEYREAARHGRIAFPMSELAVAGVPAQALGSETPSAELARYLERLRAGTREHLGAVAAMLPAAEHAPQRHLLVLAALEARRLYASGTRGARAGLSDLITAWRTARRAARRV